MTHFSMTALLLVMMSVLALSAPLLTVVSVTAGDYYAEVTAKMNQNGVIYVYPLPTEVQVAPDDSTIITYGFSVNATAGVNSKVYVEELNAKSSYNLYISGRNDIGETSVPSRLVEVITTLAPTAPILTITGHISHKESVILRYTLTSAGTIWCRAYTEEERDYVTVDSVYKSVQGLPAVAHIESSYVISNLEPNTDYYTFCVAEDTEQIPMNNTLASTERHVITLAGNDITTDSITIHGMTNVRANVYNYTVIKTLPYDYPTIDMMKGGLPTMVIRKQAFSLQWNNLINATEYAISLYTEDHKGVPTEQSITSTTFFISTDVVRCMTEDGYNSTTGGQWSTKPCQLGWGGVMKKLCTVDGVWSEEVNECERLYCPAVGDWPQTPSLSELTIDCSAGFTGKMTRACSSDGTWNEADMSQCVQITCSADNEWPVTNALTTAIIPCGPAYFGDKSRVCSATGVWGDIIDSGCVAKQQCTSDKGWDAAYEGDILIHTCQPGYSGKISRLCMLGGSWADEVNECEPIYCPEQSIWGQTPANTTAVIACPIGESGVMTRYCDINGEWMNINTTQCVQRYCETQGVWNTTLAGLTIPGPCRENEFGESHRTCSYDGIWSEIDYSQCMEKGCIEDNGWPSTPIYVTLRKDCASGYKGYQYRHCSATGSWSDVDTSDCERIYCPAVNGFPTTGSNEHVMISCGEHYEGMMSADCNKNGVWTNMDVHECVPIPTCPEEGMWPQTNINTIRTLACGVGITGTMTRACQSDGTWGAADSSQCVQLTCPSDAEWPETNAGLTSYKPCPNGLFGYIRRVCSVTGEWSEVIDDYCFDTWCLGINGWPDTPAGHNATMQCSAGFRGNQTRYCNPTGEWSPVNDDACEIIKCLAEEEWPETIHNTKDVTIACPRGYSGMMTRDCSSEGIWSEIHDDACLRKYCLAEGTWPLTPSLSTVHHSCPSGYDGSVYRVCDDGYWKEVVYNCSRLMCPEEEGWHTTADTIQERECGRGYTGMMTRYCNATGNWHDVNTTQCVQIKCPAFDGWQEGVVDEVQIKPCTSGLHILKCNEYGQWEGDPNFCYSTFCGANGIWPTTIPGTLQKAACPSGYDGMMTRYCSSTGEWGEVNMNTCYPQVCSAMDDWPTTSRNTITSIPCPSHCSGYQHRECLNNGLWGTIDQSDCIPHSCPKENEWPMTSIDMMITLTCGLGQRGYKTRRCNAAGVWGNVDDSNCVQIVCYKEGIWPTTNALETVVKECDEGLIGSISRTCSAGGIWGDIVNTCHEPTCPQENDWPETIVNKQATIQCPAGYSGMYSRHCQSNQQWSEPDMSTCTRLHCTTDGIWITTNTLTNATIPCGNNQIGMITRYCNANQQWSEPDSSECRPNYCVQDTIWPDTYPNQTATKPCGAGYRGMMTRACSSNAYWQEIDRSACLLIPQHTLLLWSAHAHYVTLQTTFNINTHVYLLAKGNLMAPPSVNDVITKGTHTFCESQTECKAIVSSLTPETIYDVYYWYKSEDDAEPLESITTMMNRIKTTPVIPFTLSITNVQTELHSVQIEVQMEERGGKVWCRVHEIDILPSVGQMKLSTPLQMQDGQVSNMKQINDLSEETHYYGYCYAEDDYNDVMQNTIISTKFEFTTKSEGVNWTTEMTSNSTTSMVTSLSNRNMTMCCVFQLDATPMDYDTIMSTGYCIDAEENIHTTLYVPTEDDTDYWVTCAAFTETLIKLKDETSHSHHTVSRAPEVTILSSSSTYQSISLQVQSDRPAKLWCRAYATADKPSIEDLKQTSYITLLRDVMNEMIISNVNQNTMYTIWCYGETHEGLMMEEEMISTTVQTKPNSAIVSIFTVSPAYDRVLLSISVTVPSTVKCLVNTTHTIPTLINFEAIEGKWINSLDDITILNLSENTEYYAWCISYDQYNQVNMNSIESTEVEFKTPFDRPSLFMSLHQQSQLDVAFSLISSDEGQAWCTVSHKNEIVLNAETIKQEGESKPIQQGSPLLYSFTNLLSNYHYQGYCYIENERGYGMIETINSTRLFFTTSDYPVLTVMKDTTGVNPTSEHVRLVVTVSTESTLYCRAREHNSIQTPPSEEWIMQGLTMAVTQPALPLYVTIASLLPSTQYDIYCTAKTEATLSSLQPLDQRMISITTPADLVKPSIVFATSSSDYMITDQHLHVNITFTKSIIAMDESKIVYSNCKLLSSLRYSNNLYFFEIIPLSHGVFSFTIPETSVTDLHGNKNVPATFTRYYKEGYVSVQLKEIGTLYADISVRYTYDATVSCVVIPSKNTSLTADAILTNPNVITRQVTSNVDELMKFTNIAVNHTQYAYCYAVEENDIVMSNTIASTEVPISVGWLQCPFVQNQVCNNHGYCLDGLHCECNKGYYGDKCTNSCPGLIRSSLDIEECSGHGVCDTSSYQCKCHSNYEGDRCLLTEIKDTVPKANHVFVYSDLIIQLTTDFVSDYDSQENKYTLMSILMDELQLSVGDMTVKQWTYKTVQARRLEEHLQVKATVQVQVEQSKEQETKQFFMDSTAMADLSKRLNANGFENTGIESSHVFSQNSNQQDTYSCYDGILNEGEADVDCGGICSTKCEVHKVCRANSDCASDICKEGQCQPLLSPTMIVIIVLAVILVIGCVVLMIFLCNSKKLKQQAQEAQRKEIEMVKQQKEQEIRDLEKLNAMEEEELKVLEEKVRQKQERRRRRQQRDAAGANPETRVVRTTATRPLVPIVDETPVTEIKEEPFTSPNREIKNSLPLPMSDTNSDGQLNEESPIVQNERMDQPIQSDANSEGDLPAENHL